MFVVIITGATCLYSDYFIAGPLKSCPKSYLANIHHVHIEDQVKKQ